MEIRRLKELLLKIPKARPRLLYSLALECRLRNKFHSMSGTSSFELFVRQFRYALAVSMTVVIIVTSSGYAYASPNVAHGDVLFPVKRALEKVRLAVTISSEERATYIAHLADRRAIETVTLVNVRARALDTEEVRQSLDDVVLFSDSAVAALSDVQSTLQVNRALIRVQDRMEKISEKIRQLPAPPERIMIVLKENTEDLSNIRPSIATALQADQKTFQILLPRKPDITDFKERYEYQLEKLSSTFDDLPKTPVFALPAITADIAWESVRVSASGTLPSTPAAARDDLAILAKKIRNALDSGDFETARKLLRKLHNSVHSLKIVPRVMIDTSPRPRRVKKISPVDPRESVEHVPPDEPPVTEPVFSGPPAIVSPSSSFPILKRPHVGPPDPNSIPSRKFP